MSSATQVYTQGYLTAVLQAYVAKFVNIWQLCARWFRVALVNRSDQLGLVEVGFSQLNSLFSKMPAGEAGLMTWHVNDM